MGEALKSKSLKTGTGIELWFVVRKEKLLGPYTQEQMEKKISDGSLNLSEFCWKNNFQEWRPLFSVEEFHHVKNNKELRSQITYPTLAIPSKTKSPSPASSDTQEKTPDNVLKIPRFDNQKVTVSLSRTKTQFLSVYEWATAALCALLFGWIMVKIALQNLEDDFKHRIDVMRIAEHKQSGNHQLENTLHPHDIDVLKSAPGFEAVLSSETNLIFDSWGHFTLQQSFKAFNGAVYNVENKNFPPQTWKSEDHGLDPVYQKPHHVKLKVIKSENGLGFQIPYSANPFK